jgi:hypothetical protein
LALVVVQQPAVVPQPQPLALGLALGLALLVVVVQPRSPSMVHTHGPSRSPFHP